MCFTYQILLETDFGIRIKLRGDFFSAQIILIGPRFYNLFTDVYELSKLVHLMKKQIFIV
jgi:hypothetical protein